MRRAVATGAIPRGHYVEINGEENALVRRLRGGR